MKMTASIDLNWKGDEAKKAVLEATRLAMRDTVMEIANDAIHKSPAKTGNNRRSVHFGVSGMGHQQASPEGRDSGDTWTGEDRSVLNDSKLEGAIYSSSGYGGHIETGTARMPARPYMKPALDRHFTKEKMAGKVKGYLK